MDDEYKWAGVEDPKVMVTTSRDPSSRLKMFAKVSLLSKRQILNYSVSIFLVVLSEFNFQVSEFCQSVYSQLFQIWKKLDPTERIL